MTRKDLVEMTDSGLNDWCIKHDLHGCKDGDCGARRCIWCGSDVDWILAEITKEEEQDDL